MSNIFAKVLKNNSLNINEFNEMILKYCKINEKSEPSSSQLNDILALFQNGIFNINSIKESIFNNPSEYGLEIIKLIDKNGQIIKMDVNELPN